MRKNPDASIYPYLVAEFIEARKDGGTVEAITFMTHENLREFKDAHQRKIKEDKTILEAESREKHIFAVLTDIEHSEGNLGFILTTEVKKLITPIIADILFLYEHRLGKQEGARLAGLLSSNRDEPMRLIISYKKDDTGTYFIKKMILEKIK